MKPLRVLVGYESSGTVREAFRRLGHEAYSCDLQPADDGSPFHFHGPVQGVIHGDWDLGIFHPPCTYLTISAAWAFRDPDYDRYPGVGYHQQVRPSTLTGEERRAARQQALAEVRMLMALPYAKAIENPVGAISGKRISELRQMGWPILRTLKHDPRDGQRYARYYLQATAA